MMIKQMKEYVLGDIRLQYYLDEEKHIGLEICPDTYRGKEISDKITELDGLVQVKLVGDMYRGAYAPGISMREGHSTKNLKFADQYVEDNEDTFIITTVLVDDRGYEAKHILKWKKNTTYLRVRTTYENKSEKTIKLEMLSSFSLHGLTNFLEGDGHDGLLVHRLRSRWSEEGKHICESLEDLQLNASWNLAGVRSERFGSIGSMPVNGFFPFVAMEDTVNHIYWGVQLASPSSWQIEVYREDENISISGGIADREFGHWVKELKAGEIIETPEAIISCATTDNFDVFTKRLADAGKEFRENRPMSEAKLPIIFNEYCTTWGCPSHENIANILKAIHGKDFSYFVIDCGWYKEEGIPWDIGMGDYEVSKELFPKGLEKTVELIKGEGYKPGIWFEIENVGSAARAYNETVHLLKRDGEVLTTTRRRFWDMNDPWVINYLDEKVIGTIKKYGFEYLKVDYNDEIGIGCDGKESLGEALRLNMLESYKYFEKIQREIPNLIIENCASGGHRLEPGYMERSSMASFSDAHECKEIPIVAANLHHVFLPEQSQIWAVIRESDSLKRIAYSVINTFLGRMCISGDVTNLTIEQWNVIDTGMDFYQKIAPIIKDGQSYIYQENIRYMHHPEGWQVVVRVGDHGEAFITIHTFGGKLTEEIKVKLPNHMPTEIAEVFSDTEEQVHISVGYLVYRPKENDKALAVYLKL